MRNLACPFDWGLDRKISAFLTDFLLDFPRNRICRIYIFES